MRPPLKLIAFGTAIALVFAASVAVGAALPPVGLARPADAERPSMTLPATPPPSDPQGSHA